MILGLIPARGGSKGIPRKNLRKIAGKPLIAWTIEAAQEASRLERFVVSTEDGEIAEVAREYGAEVLDRPQHLASDRATSLSVWQHTLNSIPASVLVNIYPTSPIRDQGLIDSVVKQFIDLVALPVISWSPRYVLSRRYSSGGSHMSRPDSR